MRVMPGFRATRATMNTGRIEITEAAVALFHLASQMVNEGAMALHITWLTPEGNGVPRWIAGLTPEADILSSSPEMQDWIVAGRCNGILVVVDGPGNVPAKGRDVRIDTRGTQATFSVAVFGSER